MYNQQNHLLVINAFDRYYANKQKPTLADLMRETGLTSESIFEEVFREFREAFDSAKKAGDAANAIDDWVKSVEPILDEIANDLIAAGYLRKRYTLPIGTRNWILLEGRSCPEWRGVAAIQSRSTSQLAVPKGSVSQQSIQSRANRTRSCRGNRPIERS